MLPVGAVHQGLDFLVDLVAGLPRAVRGLPHLLAHKSVLVAATPCDLAQLLAEAALGDHHLGCARHLRATFGLNIGVLANFHDESGALLKWVSILGVCTQARLGGAFEKRVTQANSS